MAETSGRAEPLTGQQIQVLRQRLEIERDRLRGKIATASNARAAEEAQDPLLSDPEDFGEMAQDITQEETEAALSANDAQLLGKVEHALQRVEAGTYGFSEVTGKQISYERLDALPWATTNVGETVQRS